MTAKDRQCEERQAEGWPGYVARLPYPDGMDGYLEIRNSVPRDVTVEQLRHAMDTGFLPGKMNIGGMRREHLLVVLVDELNAVIDGFNVILDELCWLPTQSILLTHGSPAKKIELLARAALSEFYQGKEILLRVIKEMVKDKLVSKSLQREARQAIEQELGQILKLRHASAHGEAGIVGGDLFLVRLYEHRRESGILDDPDGLTAWPLISASLTRCCKNQAQGQYGLGCLFAAGFGELVHILATAEVPGATNR